MATTKHTNQTEQGTMNDITPTEMHTLLNLNDPTACRLGFAALNEQNAASLTAKGLVENAGFHNTRVHRITTAGRIVADLLRKLHSNQD